MGAHTDAPRGGLGPLQVLLVLGPTFHRTPELRIPSAWNWLHSSNVDSVDRGEGWTPHFKKLQVFLLQF